MPPDRNSIPATGYTFRGRSLLSPIDGRIFQEPIDTLHELLQGKSDNQRRDGKPAFPAAVVDVLSRYEIIWDKTLGELKAAGLMGQALTGFHQELLRRDVTLPRGMPDATRLWIKNVDLKTLDSEVVKLLDTPDTNVDWRTPGAAHSQARDSAADKNVILDGPCRRIADR